MPRSLRSVHDRAILRLAVPAFGALVAEPLYVLADTAVVGHLGTPQLGGLAIANTVLVTLFALFIFLAYGTTSVVSRLLGAGDERRAAHQSVQALWLAVAIGVVLVAMGQVLAGPLVDLLGASDVVRPHALLYLRISLFGVPAMLVVFAGTGYLRGLQNTRTPFVVAVATGLLNLGLELLLIYGLGFGLGASALTTVLAQVVAAVAYVAMILRAVRPHGVAMSPDRASLRQLATVSRDLFVRTAALRLSLTLATAVAARIGTTELGAHQVAFELWSFLALALDAIAIAAQALIGSLLGAKRGDEAREAGRRMIEWGILGGLVVGALIAALQPVLPAVFSDDPEVQHLAGFLLWWVAALQPVNAVVFVLDGVLIGAGDLRFLAWAMVGAGLVFVPAAGVVLALGLGVGWLWAAIGLLMIARLVALSARFAGPRWIVLGLPTRA